MKANDVAGYLTEATPGISVIGNVHHALGREMRTANRQNAIADHYGDPGKQSIRDDVIKLSQLAGKSHDIKLLQRDIFQPQRRNQFPSLIYRTGGEINADKAAF